MARTKRLPGAAPERRAQSPEPPPRSRLPVADEVEQRRRNTAVVCIMLIFLRLLRAKFMAAIVLIIVNSQRAAAAAAVAAVHLFLTSTRSGLAMLRAAGSRQRQKDNERHWSTSAVNCILNSWEGKNFKKEMRMSRETFDALLVLLDDHIFDSLCRNPALRRPKAFKLASVIFLLANGCTEKVAAHAAGIAPTTLASYVDEVLPPIIMVLRQKYCGKPSQEEINKSRFGFSYRRGLDCVRYAVDGTQIPWTPDNALNSIEYRNYKGWKSILVLAFVDSNYIFRGANIGWPGRAGDSTVFQSSAFWKRIVADPDGWLGPGGCVAADSGFGAGPRVLVPGPDDGSDKWGYYNFCHSSTRFFVEEAFGRLKNRFRILLNASKITFKVMIMIIEACILLHNWCEDHRRAPPSPPATLSPMPTCPHALFSDNTGSSRVTSEEQAAVNAIIDGKDPAAVDVCKSCCLEGKLFCRCKRPHIRAPLLVRVRGGAVAGDMRQEICDKLWAAHIARHQQGGPDLDWEGAKAALAARRAEEAARRRRHQELADDQ